MYGWRKGFGDTPAPTSATVQTAPPMNPTGYDCTSFFPWLVQPTCSAAPTNWFTQTFGGAPNYTGVVAPPAPAPPVAPVATASNPAPLTTPPASEAGAQETVNATITATQQAQQAQAQDFFSQLDLALNPGGICNQNLAISNSLGICDSTIYWAGGIALGLFVLFSMGKR